ncbi:MAG: nucleotidyl transferase AbiEii/AbiGii toxin family protein [Actinobacteria bacterium]|nr:nucleotidyl transferase AbiEii/AbiGii toxin family protein [Actinomycetota bacterium]
MLLQAIGEELGDELSLRGGTALNLLHLDFPRVSVDIDLDFVGTVDADEAGRRRPALLEQIQDLARGSGYEVIPERRATRGPIFGCTTTASKDIRHSLR